jgi:hypothetical protein
MPANVSQKYIYARARGGLGPIRGVFFVEQGVGVGWKKGVLEGVTLHIIWGIFEKYRNWGCNDAFSHVVKLSKPCDFGKMKSYLCVF